MKIARFAVGITLTGLLLAPLALRAAETIEPKEKLVLFDGASFDGWVRYLGGGEGDVDATWSAKPGGILACTGKPAGYIRTEKAYKNYKLHLEYRWTGRPGNNGILVHMVGEDRVWPKSLECQGGYHKNGDYYEIGGVEFNEHRVGGHRVRGRRVVKYGEHNEKEPGQWNVYEVWCVDGTVRPYVNGELMNEATDCSLTEGKICLQSEGAPIEFRNIYIEPATDKPWPVVPKERIELFNGEDLDGWIRFIPNDTRDADGKWTVDKVWSVRDGVIHCEGKPNGYIRTVESYANYKLHLQWRWIDKPTNSGVLLHCAGIDRLWPKCVEAQLMHENAGDFWLLSQSTIMVDGRQVGPGQFVNAKKKHPANEKLVGEWNTYEIICDGGTVKLTVNGLLQNEGTDANPASGPICLQSEGSPIEFRDIYIEPATDKPWPVVPKERIELFNGKDLSGWVPINVAPNTFSVRGGIIVSNGIPTGLMRTEKQYENFIIELEWRHMKPGGNAGLFVWGDGLSAVGSPFARGMEVQILDNGFDVKGKNEWYTTHGDVFPVLGATMTPTGRISSTGERSFPIEERSKDSPQWNHYRLEGRDGVLRLSVNGKEVTVGKDCSPRKGYLCLESEGSECHFRNIRICELPSTNPSADEIAEPAEGFVPLYTGADLSGWKADPGHDGHWQPKDWRLVYDGKSEAKDKNLWTEKKFGDFVLICDWRWTRKPEPKPLPVILPSGEQVVDDEGQPKLEEVPNAGDSGIYLRGNSKSQVNIWCWPIGSGEVYGYRTDKSMSPEVRAGVTPKKKADAPIGKWNRFIITMRGDRLTVNLNGEAVIEDAQLPGVPARGPIALQHHGDPIEFANIFVKEID